jgi:lathosterol oxidase
MDEVLTLCDEFALDKLYPASMPRDDPVRQMLSLLGIVTTGGIVLYLLTATVSYYLIFDHKLMKHKRFLKNQVRLEIQTALYNIPFMSLMTCPLFLLEVRNLRLAVVDNKLAYP